jgi:SAM-dependent methyltransferase
MPAVPNLLLANRLLSCPACEASCFGTEGTSLVCGACGAAFAVRDAVVDFVGGRKETQLDAIDYDAFYGIDDPKIESSFELLHAHVGPLVDRALGSVLELGAGTGVLTSGVVRRGSAERLLVTDVSPKMLEQCKRRVQSVAPDSRTEICYATNDGISLGARPGEFDLLLGYFVVHHILDWRKTLTSAFHATNEHGVAVFVEPNRRFHLALVMLMNRVLERLLPEMPDLPGSDLSSLLNLNGEWSFTLKYADDLAVLAPQEDKHFFDRTAFEEACHDAGWAHAKTLRFDSKNGPLETARVYASQLKLTAKGAQRFLDVVRSELPGPFALLDDVDASPSYVFVMAKREEEADLCRAARPPHRAAPVVLDEPGGRYSLVYDLEVTISSQAPFLAVDGWIAGTRPIHRVVLWLGEERASVVVGTRRVDVVRGMSRLRQHPFANLLHSGVRAVETSSPGFSDAASTGRLRIAAELDDGGIVTLAEGRKLERLPSGVYRARITALE